MHDSNVVISELPDKRIVLAKDVDIEFYNDTRRHVVEPEKPGVTREGRERLRCIVNIWSGVLNASASSPSRE